KIPRNNLANNATGGVAGKFFLEQLGPARVVIEMASDQRNINIAAFPDWFSVVDCFEHGKAARVFLNLARDSVEKARSLVARKSLPDRKSSSRCLHGRVYICCASLRNFSDSFASRGISGLEIFSF